MPVSASRSFAFIHVRKTAGSSISRVLEAADPDIQLNAKGLWDILCAHPRRRWLLATLRDLYPINSIEEFPQWHLPASVVRGLLGRKEWDRMFTFAFVRNPWDLVVSAFHFEKSYLALPYVVERERDRAEAVRRCVTFEHFVKLYPLLEPADMTSMIADAHGKILVDFVGRYENLAADFEQICKRIGLVSIDLPHENRSVDRRDYQTYYSSETRALVGRYFERDIERFAYSF